VLSGFCSFFQALVTAQSEGSKYKARTDSGWQKVEISGKRSIAGCSVSKQLTACFAVAKKA
jgi:hypothetical protein